MTVAELQALSAELEGKLSPSAVKVLEKRYLKRSEDGTPSVLGLEPTVGDLTKPNAA